MRRRVAVTGMGVVSAIGCSTASFFESLIEGRSGVRRLGGDEPLVAAPVDFAPDTHFTRLEQAALDRFAQFTLVATGQAVHESGLCDADLANARVGVYCGSGIGGAGALESAYRAYLSPSGNRRVTPMSVVMTMANAAAAHVSLRYRIRGPSLTYSVACASAAVAIGEAFRAIRDGYVDIAIAGGAEALLTPGMLSAWQAMRVLAPADVDRPERSCRPFARGRSGLVLGEGAGMLVLEADELAQRRGCEIEQEIAGYGITSDAVHLTKPSAAGQAAAIDAALEDACLSPNAIDYVNAHGTATQLGDITETNAIKQALGSHARRIPVTSTKALHGHLLGAAGAVELIATLCAMRTGSIPPTCHYDSADPDCDLDYVPNVARHGVEIGAALSNSFAFGGTNAVLAVRAA